ncbi:MAG: uracil-DNA glycosylase [Alphaproteobacteria bacterium]|nr:uracil-DNA glycosylase [Alphaproteobacteria bacterium]
MASSINAPEPPADCNLCPRLVAYRIANQQAEPSWFNGAVPSFGPVDCRLLIVGLAPGRAGANRTGRPFTGDFAGDLLYGTLSKFGFARGSYAARIDDGFQLEGCMVSNAVRCAPPENKPMTAEIKQCRGFLSARIAALTKLKVVLALGRIAHEQTLSALELTRAAYPFGHAARHVLPGGVVLFDSYHCSRYNTNTGRLTEVMFRSVFAAVREQLDS